MDFTLDELIKSLNVLRNERPGDTPVKVWVNDVRVNIYAVGTNGEFVDIFPDDEEMADEDQ